MSNVPPIGTTFDPETQVLGGVFEDWSWDTFWTPDASGTRISFDRQYAGFSLRRSVPGQLMRMTLHSRGPADISIMCGESGNFIRAGQITQSSVGSQQHVIDLSSCALTAGNVVLQNRMSGPSELVVELGEVCTTSRCYSMFETAGKALTTELQVAADWGVDNHVPIYIGEFGAYHVQVHASRKCCQLMSQISFFTKPLGQRSAENRILRRTLRGLEWCLRVTRQFPTLLGRIRGREPVSRSLSLKPLQHDTVS